MVSTQYLDEKVKDSGLKISFICDKLGMSRQAFDKKKKNAYKFKANEIMILKDLLRLTSDDIQDIFFADNV